MPVLQRFLRVLRAAAAGGRAYDGDVRVEPEKIGELCPECGGDLVVLLLTSFSYVLLFNNSANCVQIFQSVFQVTGIYLKR